MRAAEVHRQILHVTCLARGEMPDRRFRAVPRCEVEQMSARRSSAYTRAGIRHWRQPADLLRRLVVCSGRDLSCPSADRDGSCGSATLGRSGVHVRPMASLDSAFPMPSIEMCGAMVFCGVTCCGGGIAVNRDRDKSDDARDFQLANRKEGYSANRLIAAVSELRHLTENRLSEAIKSVLAYLEDAAEYSGADIETVHRLRIWRADSVRLAAELDAAARSFHLIERELGRRIDAAIDD